MKALLSFGLCLSLGMTIQARTDDFKLPVENYLRPSPNAAALVKYVDYPVSYATGVPEISIPIYTVKTKELEMPISLSYHAAGVKIGELATNVGFGWTLNCGGAVTRVVKGLPDTQGTDIRQRDQIHASDVGYLQYLETGLIDTHYDSYYYNFNGQSGEFMCNPKTREITQITSTDNVIRANRLSGNYDEIDSFTITTPDGVVYEFTEKENTSNGNYNIVSSWYLSKVMSHNRTDSLVFTYATDPNWEHGSPFTSICELVDGLSTPQIYGSMTYYSNCKRLSSVKYNSGKVEFLSSLDRQDGPKSRLNAINCSDNRGNVVLRADFDNNAYFSGPRLKLRGLKFTGAGGGVIDEHKFSYINETALISTDAGYDLFGFYNGALSGGQGSRFYSFDHAQSFMLDRIDHITGGYTKFTYEPNGIKTKTFWDTPLDINIGIRVSKIETFEKDFNKLYTRSFEYLQSVPTIDFSKINGSCYLSSYLLNVNIVAGIEYLVFESLSLSSASVMPEQAIENARIYHTQVAEKQYGSLQDTLKTVYTFSQPHSTYIYCETKNLCPFLGGLVTYSEEPVYVNYLFTRNLSDFGNPFLRSFAFTFAGYFPNVNWMYGHLLDKEVYSYENNRYKLVERTHNVYDGIGFSAVTNGIYNKCLRRFKSELGAASKNDIRNYYYFNTLRYVGRNVLSLTTVTKYFDSGNVVEQTQYTYPEQGGRKVYGFPRTQSVNYGNVRTRRFYYSFDYTDSVNTELAARNRINIPVKTELIENGRPVASLETVCARTGSVILPTSTFLKKGNMSEIADRYDVLAYDLHRNPVYVSRNDESKRVYIWGYNWSEPVAEIRNAAYEEVLRLDSGNMIARIGESNDLSGDSAEMRWLHALRGNLPDAEVTIFTYVPLLGIESVTDPAGRTTYYEYDTANRLARIRDENGNVLEAYEYHYRNN